MVWARFKLNQSPRGSSRGRAATTFLKVSRSNLVRIQEFLIFAPLRFGRMETETKLNEERLKAEEKLRKEETRFDSIPLRFDDL